VRDRENPPAQGGVVAPEATDVAHDLNEYLPEHVLGFANVQCPEVAEDRWGEIVIRVGGT
jgi:hypothetical protein